MRARWPGLLNHVREAFEARDDIDRCAPRRADERKAPRSPWRWSCPTAASATRPVSRREDVLPTLEALLLVPRRRRRRRRRALAPSTASTSGELARRAPAEASPLPAADVPSTALSPPRTATPGPRSRGASPRPPADRAVGPHGRSHRRRASRASALGALSFLELSRMARGVRGAGGSLPAARRRAHSRRGHAWSSQCWGADASVSAHRRSTSPPAPRRGAAGDHDVETTVPDGRRDQRIELEHRAAPAPRRARG